MKNLFILLLSFVSMTVFAHGPVPVNIEASTIKWTATKVTGEHYGSVQFKEAELDVQNGQLKGGSFTVDMNTIQGKTHPLTFEANLANNTATATLKIDRTLYDVRYRSTKFFDALGDKAIYDEFTLEVSMSY